MTLSQLAVLNVILSVVSFVVFFYFAYQRAVEVKRLMDAAKANLVRTPQTTAPGEIRTDLQGIPNVDKILDSMANLTKSLSKAPMHVVTLVAAMFFMLIALAALGVQCWCDSETEPPKKEASLIAPTRCVVGYFSSGDSRMPDSVTDSPRGCLGNLQNRMKTDEPPFVVAVGHVDFRELQMQPRKIYGDNLSLAYQRAVSVQTYLAGKSIFLLTAGASHVNTRDPNLLLEDRMVEIWYL
jgi:hypothetical protein